MSTADEAFGLLEHLDALRRPARLDDFLAAATSLDPALAASSPPLRQARDAARAIPSDASRAAGLSGKALAEALREERSRAAAVAWLKSV